MKISVYDIITDRVIAALEAGVVPWRKPWASSSAGMPRNLKSGTCYRGINIFILAAAGFGSPYWVTFNQAKALGGSVRKGAKGTPVVFWKWLEKDQIDPESGEKVTDRFPMLRYYTVFNVEQCDGLTVPTTDAVPAPADTTDVRAAAAIVASMPQRPAIEHGGDRASYSPMRDAIRMPVADVFTSQASYFGTLFHEMVHSTGHESRLGRPGITDPIVFGSESYSREELVAEMGAAFLAARAGISDDAQLANSAAYVQGWLTSLKNDRKLVVTAAAQAQKAADFILGGLAIADDSADA